MLGSGLPAVHIRTSLLCENPAFVRTMPLAASPAPRTLIGSAVTDSSTTGPAGTGDQTMGSKSRRVSNVPMLLALSAGLTTSAFSQAAPVDKVKLKVWLTSVTIKDDMDDRLTRGCGDLAVAYNVGVEGQASTGNSAGALAKNSDGKPMNICDNSTLGINQLILDKDLCCPLPDLELVIDLWDDDDSTADQIAKISSTLGGVAAGVILAADGKPIADALEAIRKALELEGKPTSDSMGTAVDLDAHPPGACIFCDGLTTDHDVKLNGGTGAKNGSVKLTWKSCKIGTCAPIPCDSGGPPPTPPEDNIEKARAGQSSDDELDLHLDVGDDVLQVPMPAGQTRDFIFGIDTDLNPATGRPANPPLNALIGCEKRVRIHQQGTGFQNNTSAVIESWSTMSGWSTLDATVKHYSVRGREVVAYVSKSELQLGSNFTVMMELQRNGVTRDVEPNNQQAQRHYVTWLPQGPGVGEPPSVTSVARIDDTFPPQYHIRYTFNEAISIGPNSVNVSGSAANVVTGWRSLDVYFQSSSTIPSEQMHTLTLNPISITDSGGNHLDGNADGIPGDEHLQLFDPPERRLTFCDNAGNAKNEFLPGQAAFITSNGVGLGPNGPRPFYRVANGGLLNGQPLVDISPTHAPTIVQLVDSGSLPLTSVGTPCDEGASHNGDFYESDGVLDLNSDGLYTLGTDILFKSDGIGLNAGKFLDQNSNGVRDKIDILLGTSQDTDADGIPDEITACRGDLSFDGLVDDIDFVMFAGAYNLLDCADDLMPPHCQSDLNRDGIVDDDDFSLFATRYNELICPS